MLDNSLVNSDSVYRLQHRDQRGSTKLLSQVVTKRCLLSWLTNNALDKSPNTGGKGGGVAGSQPMSKNFIKREW
jgi:hypothetical protein